MKVLKVIDFQYLYYKYKFTIESGKLARLSENGKDTTYLFYPLNEIASITKKGTIDTAICFDSPNIDRKDEDDSYKAKRKNMLSPEDRENILEIQRILEKAGYQIYKKEKKEADDLVKTVIDDIGDRYDAIDVYTKDSDMLQLVNKKVSVHLYKQTKGYIIITYDNFETIVKDKVFGTYVPYNMVMAYKATVGDNSDGIKGIPGFGDSAFNKWITQYAASINFEMGVDKEYVESLLENTMKPDKFDSARKSLEKVALRYVDGLPEFVNRCTIESKQLAFEEYGMLSLV